MLATHDLEIRGAGELLGQEQSGHIHKIGYSLYMEMLNKTVAALQRGDDIDIAIEDDNQALVELNIPALIPDEYLPDIHTRLTLYKRIAEASSSDELLELQVEMVDRFGRMPQATADLLHLSRIKLAATPLGIASIKIHRAGGGIEFNNKTTVDPMRLIKLVQEDPQTYKLVSGNKLGITKELLSAESRIEMASGMIAALA